MGFRLGGSCSPCCGDGGGGGGPVVPTSQSCFSHPDCLPENADAQPQTVEITLERADKTEDYYCIQVAVEDRLYPAAGATATYNRTVSIPMAAMEGTFSLVRYRYDSVDGRPDSPHQYSYRYQGSGPCMGKNFLCDIVFDGHRCDFLFRVAALYDDGSGGGAGDCLSCSSTAGAGFLLNDPPFGQENYIDLVDIGSHGSQNCGSRADLSVDLSSIVANNYVKNTTLKYAATWNTANRPFDEHNLFGSITDITRYFTGRYPMGFSFRYLVPVDGTLVETGSPVLNITNISATW